MTVKRECECVAAAEERWSAVLHCHTAASQSAALIGRRHVGTERWPSNFLGVVMIVQVNELKIYSVGKEISHQKKKKKKNLNFVMLFY